MSVGLHILHVSLSFLKIIQPWLSPRSCAPAKVYQRFGPWLSLQNYLDILSIPPLFTGGRKDLNFASIFYTSNMRKSSVTNDRAAWTNVFHCFLSLTCPTSCLLQVHRFFLQGISIIYLFFYLLWLLYPTLMLLTLLLVKAGVIQPLYMSVLLYLFVYFRVSIWFKLSLMSIHFSSSVFCLLQLYSTIQFLP